MEQKRLLLAIGLSFLVFFLWSIAFGPKPTEKPVPSKEPAGKTEAAAAPQKKPAPAVAPAEKKPEIAETTPAPAATTSQVAKREARTITVDTPLFRMRLSERGGAVVSMVLKKYRETVSKDSPLKELIPPELKGGTVLTALSGLSREQMEKGIYSLETQQKTLTVDQEPASVRFRYTFDDGVVVDKTYHFSPKTYVVGLNVNVYNGSEQAMQSSLGIGLRDIISSAKISPVTVPKILRPRK